MKKMFAVLLALCLLLGVSGAMAETVTTELMKMSDGLTIVLHHDESVEITIIDHGVPEIGFWLIDDHVHAPVHLGICRSVIDGELSLADLSEEEQMQYATLYSFLFEDPIIHLDTTPSGNLYLHICSNEAHEVDTILTLYKGTIVELIQHALDDFGPLQEEDKAFCFDLLYGIEFVTE
jgi:hypothetical protein